MIALPPSEWKKFRTMSAEDLGNELKRMAPGARLSAYKKHRRGEKKPVPKRVEFTNKKHVSTARLLAQTTGNAP
jgi:hypothetical protein